MITFRYALLASAVSALSIAAAPGAWASGLTFANYTLTNGLGSNNVRGVYASGSTIYAATLSGGLSIASLPDPNPVPGPLPVLGAASAFGFSRRLRRRLRASSCASMSR